MRNPLSVIKNSIQRILKIPTNATALTAGALRPYNYDYRRRTGHFVVANYPYPLHSVYLAAYNSDVLTTVHNSLRREIFRNGLELLPASKTDADVSSDQEAEGEIKEEEMTEEQLIVERQRLLDRLMDVNDNAQSVVDICYQIEDDFSIIDDGYMMFLNNYSFNQEGEIIKKDLKEVIRADPKFMALVMNRQDRFGYDDDGNILSVCPIHRSTLLTNQTRCNAQGCELKTIRAFYRHYGHGAGHELYYFKDEVVHRSKYRPGTRLGHSPIFTLWQKLGILNAMDEYTLEMYVGKRPPKGMLVFNTANQESLKAAWDDMTRRAKENPHLPAIMSVENKGHNGGPKKFVEFIDFMKGLDELQYTEQRNEMRRQIGAVYGVLPIWQGDLSQGGGLNNEGMQVTVTNRAVEYGQSLYNDYFLPKVLEAMDVKGWVLKLRPSEEQDEQAKLQRQSLALDNGAKAVSLGLEVSYVADSDEVKILSGELSEPVSGFGEFGGEDSFAGSGGGSGSPVNPVGTVKKNESRVYKSHYLNAYSKHGDSPQGVLWKDKNSQVVRFEVIAKAILDDSPDVLDVGCGTGHFAAFLVSKGKCPNYSGLDIEPSYVARAIQKGLNAVVASVDDIEGSYDYVVASGTFNLGRVDIRKSLKKMYSAANKSMIVNLVSKAPDGAYNVYNPNAILQFAKTQLSKDSKIVEGYIPGDFTLVVNKRRAPFTELSKILQREIGKFIKTFKKKPTEEQMQNMIDKLRKDLDDNLKTASEGFFRKAYKRGISQAENDLGVQFGFGDVDENALQALREQKVLSDSFAGVRDDLTSKAQEVLRRAYETPNGLSLSKITEELKEALGVADSQAETIARTESGKVSSAARRISYGKDPRFDTFKFKHIGPNDNRTTDTSKRIKSRTKGGVSWDDYVLILTEESAKDFPDWTVDKNAPMSHYSSRHTYVRVVNA